MAVRNPLYVSGGNLVAMTFGEIEPIYSDEYEDNENNMGF